MSHKPSHPESLYNDVSHLVAEDRLREAIDRLNDSRVPGLPQGDLSLLQRRLSVIETKDRLGTAAKDELAAASQEIANAILETARDLSASPPDQALPRSLEPAEIKARSRYLKQTRQHVENLLHESIHNARFIDLGVADTPIATVLPWVYKNTETAQQFASIRAAFDAYDRRLLILGTPGSGKTVTLLHLALDLIAEAERNLSAPIPLIVNLSKFQFGPSAPHLVEWLLAGGKRLPGSNRSFDGWLAAELAERPGVAKSDARRWVEEGRIAALLDGLDEVNDERRAEMAVLLNDTFLPDHPDSIAVICSRTEEYRPLQERKTTRLQLPGAITLQPLSPAQVGAYLDEVRAAGLREALGRDSTLEELAQTPLTLSMMALAYGGMSVDAIPTFRLAADQRHHLMESFVSRMLQRKERRDRRIPFDDDKDKAVEPADYCYRHDQFNRYLSWWAVRLSVRMQTAASLGKFHSFLARGQNRLPQTIDGWVVILSRAVLLTICTLLAVVGFAPLSASFFLAISAVFVGYCGASYMIPALKSWRPRTDEETLSFFVIIPLAVFWLAALSQSVVAVGPPGLSALPTGLIMLTGIIALVNCLPPISNLMLATSTFVGGLVGAAVIGFPWNSGPPDGVMAVTMVSGQMFGILALVWRDGSERWAGSGLALAGLAVILALQAATTWLVGSVHWSVAFTIVALVLMLTLAMLEKPAGPLAGFAVASALGGLLLGKEGSLIAGAVLLIVIVTIALGRMRFKFLMELERRSNNLLEDIQTYAERWILAPTSLFIIASLRLLPWQLRNFLRYAGQALVLKPYRGEVEFVHRRLRDYFALRELVPQLRRSDAQDLRVDVIRALGFQGVAAIDLLAELMAEARTEERAVAVSAIARISAPEIANHLERALADPAAEVRRAVVSNLRNISAEKREYLLSRAVDDPELSVKTAVIDATNEPDLAESFVGKLLATEQARLAILRYISIKEGRVWIRVVSEVLSASCKATLEALLLDTHAQARATACGWMQENPSVANATSIMILLRADANASVRAAAARALGRLEDPRAIEPLMQALADKHFDVRIAAAAALGRLGDLQAVEPLSRALTDKEDLTPSVANNRAKPNWLNRILYFFNSRKDTKPSARGAIAIALGNLCDARAVRALLQALKDNDPGVRGAAEEALSGFVDPQAVETLVRALKDENSDVRRVAALVLGQLGDKRASEPLVLALGDNSSAVCWAAVDALSSLGDPQLAEQLVQVLEDEDKALSVRWMAAIVLGRLGDKRAIGLLIQTMGAKSPQLREAAAEALGRLSDAQATEVLVQALGDRAPDVRWAAARALRSLRDPRAIMPLSQALADKDYRVRRMAAIALGEFGDVQAVGALVRALRDRYLHYLAADALSHLPGGGGVDALVQALADKDLAIRQEAARAFGRSGDARAVELLVQTLADKASLVRSAAADALAELGDTRTAEPVSQLLRDQDSEVRQAAARALGELGNKQAVEPLIQALADTDSDVREAAIQSLGKLGNEQAVGPLIQALADTDSDVRQAAVQSLGKLGNEQAVEPLIQALADENSDLREEVALALGVLGNARAVEALMQALTDRNSTVRLAATEALGRLGVARGAILESVSPIVRRAFVGAYAEKRSELDQSLLSDLDYIHRWRQTGRINYETGDKLMAMIDSPWMKLEERQYMTFRRTTYARHSWIDPHLTITALRVTTAARVLNLTADVVRSRYELMADDLNLKLAWKS